MCGIALRVWVTIANRCVFQVKILQEQVLAGQGRLEGRVAALGSHSGVDGGRASILDARIVGLEQELAAAQRTIDDKDRHVAQYRCVG
jgi:hypothetical protein